MSFWRGETLKARGESIVRPFDASNVDCNAYTLHVGSTYYVTPGPGRNADDSTIRQLAPDQSFCVPPGHFALLITDEEVRVPRDAMAFISMKSSTKFHGLVNVSGFHVDPGYSNRLLFSVFNAAPSPVQLRRGQPLFLIWFAELDAATEQVKPEQAGWREIPTALVQAMSQETYSPKYVLDELRKVESSLRSVEKVNNLVQGLVSALVIGLVLTVVGLLIGPMFSPGRERCENGNTRQLAERTETPQAVASELSAERTLPAVGSPRMTEGWEAPLGERSGGGHRGVNE